MDIEIERWLDLHFDPYSGTLLEDDEINPHFGHII
jgi:hypothetical protein